jgi:hypothetical protein
MIKLSQSQNSPFDLGLFKNLQFVYCRKEFEKMEDTCINSHLDWKQILTLKKKNIK